MKILFTSLILLLATTTYIQAQTSGSPDKTFGESGKALDTTLWADCQAMAVQIDGKIVTGGFTDPGYGNFDDGGFYVARYNQDGSIDESFGEKGKFVIRKINGAAPYQAQAIAIQHDGKIVACGRFITHSPYGNVGLLRLYTDGKIDSSFGVNGFITTKLGKYDDLIGGMVLQPDGKIVVAGNTQSAPFQPGPDFVLRYLSDGTQDMSFGNKGVVLTSYTDANVYLGALTLQEDGKILTGGIYATSKRRYQAVRYNNDGSLDKSFGEEGFARLLPELYDQAGLYVYSMTIQNNGKIVLGGSAGGAHISLTCFNSNGTVDEGFGDKKGYTILPMDIGSGIARSVFYSAADNKIIATALYHRTAAQQVAAIRYNENGIVDSSFGENGIAAGGFSGTKYGADFSSGVGALQPDGKIIVSGSFSQNDGDTYDVALFRFNDDTTRQPLAIRIKRWLQHHGITWQSLQGNNNIHYYAIQRSQDGIVYKEVAKTGKKQEWNNYEDISPLAGSSYYRIAAVSWDGSSAYSNTVLFNEAQQARIFPNPVKDKLQLQGLPSTGKTSISVMDLSGNVRSTAIATGTNYSVSTTNLSSGSYLLKIQHNDITTTQPFVKE